MISTTRLCSLGRVQPGDVPQVGGERLLHPPGLALAGLRLGPRRALQRVGVQHAGDDVDHRQDVEQVLAVPGADDRPVPLDPQRRGRASAPSGSGPRPGSAGPARPPPPLFQARPGPHGPRPASPGRPAGSGRSADRAGCRACGRSRCMAERLARMPWVRNRCSANSAWVQLARSRPWPGRPLDDPAADLLGQLGRELGLGPLGLAGPQPVEAALEVGVEPALDGAGGDAEVGGDLAGGAGPGGPAGRSGGGPGACGRSPGGTPVRGPGPRLRGVGCGSRS